MSDTEQKKKPASKQKLRKQREKGSIPSSADVAAFSSTAFSLFFLLISAPFICQEMANFFSLIPDVLEMQSAEALDLAIREIAKRIFLVVIPVVIISIFISVIIALIANGGILTSLKPVTPDFSKLSLAKGFKRIFGKRGWTEFIYTTLRLLLWILFVTFVITVSFSSLMHSHLCGLNCEAEVIALIFRFLLAGAIILLIIFSFATLRVQRSLFLKDQRMTESEVKKEKKDQSSSEEVRKERSRLNRVSMNKPAKMTLDQADYLFIFEDQAIAVSFDPPAKMLPLLLAKAKDKEKTENLKNKLKGYSVFVSENEVLTLAGLKLELGGYLPEPVLPELSKEYWKSKRQSRASTKQATQ